MGPSADAGRTVGVGLPILQVDAFTDRPFCGNPAAVCLLAEPADEAWMQSVAAEMNLSETAFVWANDDGFGLRWFTPTVEVDLCGHATVASAHVLWADGRLAADEPARFQTRSGLLTARQHDGWIELDFPADPPEAVSVGGLESLGAPATWVGRSGESVVVEVDGEEVLRTLEPDPRRIADVPAKVVLVTSRASRGDADYVLRVFGPRVGIAEDPATGSAHCVLGPLWGERLGKDELVARQVSRRGGSFRVRVAGDRVLIAGQAVTVLRGELA